MTVVHPNHIVGINSITVQTGDSLSVHKADGSLIRTIVSNTGVSTFHAIEVSKGGGDLTVGVSTLFADNSTGRIGIGTVTPTSLLTVGAKPKTTSAAATVLISPASGDASIQMRGGSPTLEFDSTGGGNGRIFTDSADLTISNGTLDGAGDERLRIASNGEITQTGASGNTIITLKRSNTNTTGTVGGVNFAALDGHSVASIQARGDGNDEGAHIQFYTTSAAAGDMYNAANVERCRITSGGNVAIGTITASPANLTVYGDGTSDNKPATIYQNALSGGSSGNGFYVGINHDETVGYVWNYETQPLVLATNNLERLRITSGGDTKFVSTGGIQLPRGTTSERPTDTSSTTPYMRWNSTNSGLEVYNGSEWVEIITDYFPSGSTAFS